MIKKNYILIFSLVLNLILGYLIFSFLYSDDKLNEDFLKSEIKVNLLNEEISEKNKDIHSLKIKLDSINNVLALIPEERVIIKNKYYEKANSVINIPIDSSVLILSKRLSEINLNR